MRFRTRVLSLVLLSVVVVGGNAIAAGGDTCATATVIGSLPYNDAGDTTNATNQSIFLNQTCSAGGSVSRPGPDVVYAITVFPGNSLTFTVDPSANFDAAIYILTNCTSGNSCIQAKDTGIEDVPETIGPVTLPPGTSYLYIDSVYDPKKEGPDHGPYTLSVTGTLGTPNNTQFFTVTPCRVLDTRDPVGPVGGPPLIAGATRTFTITGTGPGQCQVPATAKAVSINITVTQPTSLGFLTLFPGGTAAPLASNINFRAGQTRANNAIVPLGTNGTLSVVDGQATGTTHFILDVNGYFQ